MCSSPRAGWSAPTLPQNAYGRGLSRSDSVIVSRETGAFGAVGAPAGLRPLIAATTIATHGTQAQLVALAMKLGLAKEKLAGAPADMERATRLVGDAHRGVIEAIADLRTLARGIHPPVLDNGLADALATLAARLCSRRPP